MTPRPTPETDALFLPLLGSCAYNGPCATLARSLERERDKAREDVAHLRSALKRIAVEDIFDDSMRLIADQALTL